MKLVYCKKCQDIIRLHHVVRRCFCGKCYGMYVNNSFAWYVGKHAIPVGLGQDHILEGHLYSRVKEKADLNTVSYIPAFVFEPKPPTMIDMTASKVDPLDMDDDELLRILENVGELNQEKTEDEITAL